MLEVTQVLCILLISCFNKELPPDTKCPQSCKCYSAPSGGNDWTHPATSLICDDIDKLTNDNLLKLGPINTLAIDNIHDSRAQKSSLLPNIAINNLYLKGDSRQRSLNSIPPVLGLNTNDFRLFSLINLDLNTFSWNSLNEYSLQGIYIKDCTLNTITNVCFNSKNGMNLISISIINSEVKNIVDINGDHAFDGLNNLKMMSFSRNKLKTFDWIGKIHLPNLWSLDLSDNYIETIPPNVIASMPQLRVLKLDRNNLKILTLDTLKPFLQIVQLTLTSTGTDNVLCGTKEVKDIYTYLRNNGNIKYANMFINSMQGLFCHNHKRPTSPTFSCKNLDDDQCDSLENCLQWDGKKPLA